MRLRWMAAVLLAAGLMEAAWAQKEAAMQGPQTLTPEEERVIVHKGTEAPFSGRFDKFTETGVYTCRRCGAALYRSTDKFDAGCGWPSFDAEIRGAVQRKTDADGRRTEIMCAHCGAHLGHVFTGERMTPRDTRHCVNSISMSFVPQAAVSNHFKRAVFAGGCFWGVEYFMQQATGVVQATVGYTGGTMQQPTYEDVCSHKTGHAEAVEAIYDPLRTSFENLARLFFEIHDPTQLNRQGPDVGDQYRSEIYYVDEEQKKVAEKLVAELKRQGWPVATRIAPSAVFWPAEQYHQDYYRRNGRQPYCHRPVPRFNQGPK